MFMNLEKYTREDLQKIVNESTSISEVVRKIGYKKPGGGYNVQLKKYLEENNFNTETLVGRKIKRYDDSGVPKKWLSESLCENGSGNSNSLKNRLIAYGVKQYKCENPECGISDWHGKEIVLQLHHINGNHYDNRLENLVLLCPNCHSQTSNFTSKNSSDALNKILSEVAIDEAKSGMENLLEYESQRKKEISENKKKYGKYTNEEREKRMEKRPVFYCKQCGKIITGRGKVFCSIECMTAYQREKSGIEIDKVVAKAKDCTTLIELAKYFNLTDNGIKKRLKTAGKLQEVKDILSKNKK